MIFSTKRLARLGLFSTIALTISIAESMIPPLIPIPGIKPGLSNIITLFLMITAGASDAFLVLLVRILLSSIFGGQMISFFYSISGGLLSFCIIWLLCSLFEKRWIWLVSICGGICHNIGQLAAAAIVMKTCYVFHYFPFLFISGTIAGLFTGLCTYFLLKHQSRWNFN